VDSAPTPAAHAPQIATERECAYAAQALADEISKLEALGPGDGRNHALNIAAHSMGTMSGAGWIDPVAVTQALLNAASANGYIAQDGERAAKDTIESGLNAGISKPGYSGEGERCSGVIPNGIPE
jgi:hypothetical protein